CKSARSLFDTTSPQTTSSKKTSTSLQTTFHSSSVVEQSAVNRSVAGSNPACGAIRRAVRDGRRSTIGNRVDHSRGLKGSNPLLSARFIWPVGQVVKTSPFHGGITGSNPVRVTILGGLAQLGEHLPYKQGVAGSSPASSTID